MIDTAKRQSSLRLLGLSSAVAGMSLLNLAGFFRQVNAQQTQTAALGAAGFSSGRFEIIEKFSSTEIQARRVVIWLPPGYDAVDQQDQRYSVLYMHDGQNLFDPKLAYGGQTWGVAEHLTRLQKIGVIPKYLRRTIVVGIDNSPLRWQEYAPAAAVRMLSSAAQEIVLPGGVDTLLADHYLTFLVNELKPYIDQHFRTKADRRNTFLMGSSMGGLVSLYALSSYPAVFGGAACLSTHWPLATSQTVLAMKDNVRKQEIAGVYFQWLNQHLPEAGQHHLYFDHGSEHLDALYAPYQMTMDELMRLKGYRLGVDWITQVFPGGDHNETSWRERLEIPLQFLLKV